jgi:hypothetical protein
MHLIIAATSRIDPALVERAETLQRQLAIQIYAATVFAIGFFVLLLATICVALRWNRVALGLLALYGFATFWIPSAPTLYLSPAIFFAALAGIVLLTLTARTKTVDIPPK